MQQDRLHRAHMGCLSAVLLPVGLGAAAAALAGAEQGSERLTAGMVGAMGLTFGTVFLAWAVPEEWGMAGWLARWLGWCPGVLIVALGVLMVLDREYWAAARRVGSADAAVGMGLALACVGMSVWGLWLKHLRDQAATPGP